MGGEAPRRCRGVVGGVVVRESFLGLRDAPGPPQASQWPGRDTMTMPAAWVGLGPRGEAACPWPEGGTEVPSLRTSQPFPGVTTFQLGDLR